MCMPVAVTYCLANDNAVFKTLNTFSLMVNPQLSDVTFPSTNTAFPSTTRTTTSNSSGY